MLNHLSRNSAQECGSEDLSAVKWVVDSFFGTVARKKNTLIDIYHR
jgi:hypothetical protein